MKIPNRPQTIPSCIWGNRPELLTWHLPMCSLATIFFHSPPCNQQAAYSTYYRGQACSICILQSLSDITAIWYEHLSLFWRHYKLFPANLQLPPSVCVHFSIHIKYISLICYLAHFTSLGVISPLLQVHMRIHGEFFVTYKPSYSQFLMSVLIRCCWLHRDFLCPQINPATHRYPMLMLIRCCWLQEEFLWAVMT